jgi:hypothetical protein
MAIQRVKNDAAVIGDGRREKVGLLGSGAPSMLRILMSWETHLVDPQDTNVN